MEVSAFLDTAQICFFIVLIQLLNTLNMEYLKVLFWVKCFDIIYINDRPHISNLASFILYAVEVGDNITETNQKLEDLS